MSAKGHPTFHTTTGAEASMPIFSRRIPYDRTRLLREAEAACEKKRWRRAARCYGHILAAEPNNAEMHYRIAPLLARTGYHFDAWESFRIAAQSPEISEKSPQMVALYKTATDLMPKSVEAWRELSRALLQNQQSDAALRALLEGRKRFKRRARRSEAIALLRDAHKLDPWKPDIVLDLCRLLGNHGRKAEALFLLDELDRRVVGPEQRRIRALAWRLDPTIGQTWRWLRSAFGSSRKDSTRAGYGVRRRA
jgi:tetratricopeptide (TPR) repeat protein